MVELIRPISAPSSRGPAMKVACALFCVAVVAAVAIISSSNSKDHEVVLGQYSALQVGRYAVRAERQAHGYRLDAERQIQLATNDDNEADDDNSMAIEEERRARASAYLAADVKDRIEKTLNRGRDEVKESTKDKAKAGRLSDQADQIMGLARKKLQSAKKHEADSREKMARYGKVVDKYNAVMLERRALLDQINTAGIKLADDMTAYSKITAAGAAKTAAKLKVVEDQKALAKLETDHIAMNIKTRKAKEMADKYQPLIISANKNEREGQNDYATYAKLRHTANKLYKQAAGLMDQADSLDSLIATTEEELKAKRKAFLMYKNRAEKEMSISLHAEDQEDELRRSARQNRYSAGQLFDKARRLEALSQKGLNEVMKQEEEPTPDMGGLDTGFGPKSAVSKK